MYEDGPKEQRAQGFTQKVVFGDGCPRAHIGIYGRKGGLTPRGKEDELNSKGGCEIPQFRPTSNSY